MKNYYEIFGVSQKSTIDEIKHRYRFLAQAYHPDKFKELEQKKDAEEEFKKIGEAYEVLMNPVKRVQYDRLLILIQENEKKKEFQEKFNKEFYSPPKNPQNNYSNSRSVPHQNEKAEKKGNLWLWIIIGIIIWGAYNIFIKNESSTKTQTTYQQPTQVVYVAPTVSPFVDRTNLFNAATKFADLLQNGNPGAKFLLDSTSNNYKDYASSIDVIVHDTVKWGKYLRIYDLYISSYSSNYAVVSGYMENNSFYSWLKYYLDIYLIKKGNSWYIQSWNMIKT